MPWSVVFHPFDLRLFSIRVIFVSPENQTKKNKWNRFVPSFAIIQVPFQINKYKIVVEGIKIFFFCLVKNNRMHVIIVCFPFDLLVFKQCNRQIIFRLKSVGFQHFHGFLGKSRYSDDILRFVGASARTDARETQMWRVIKTYRLQKRFLHIVRLYFRTVPNDEFPHGYNKTVIAGNEKKITPEI